MSNYVYSQMTCAHCGTIVVGMRRQTAHGCFFAIAAVLVAVAIFGGFLLGIFALIPLVLLGIVWAIETVLESFRAFICSRCGTPFGRNPGLPD